MGYQLGIDLGTTYTAAAVCRSSDRGPAEPEMISLGSRGAPVASVLFLGPDGSVLVGAAAERRAVTDPAFVAREFKRRIGDPTPILLGGRRFAPEELSARLVRWVVDRVAEREGGPADRIAVTHPASWGQHKKDLLARALAGQGLEVAFLAEPQAAALHYASTERVPAGSTIAVYDLGGGTFDAAVVRKGEPGSAAFGLLGRPEGIERLGGIDFDDVVFSHVVAGMPEAFADLDDADPAVLSAVSGIRRDCTEAKEALSSDTEVSIPVLLPAARGSVRLHRSEFEQMIGGQIEETVEALRRAVASARLTPEQLTAVLLVGGSSRIPLVAQLVSERLGRPVAVDADPKNAIAKGAALSLVPHAAASSPGVLPPQLGQPAQLPPPAQFGQPAPFGQQAPPSRPPFPAPGSGFHHPPTRPPMAPSPMASGPPSRPGLPSLGPGTPRMPYPPANPEPAPATTHQFAAAAPDGAWSDARDQSWDPNQGPDDRYDAGYDSGYDSSPADQWDDRRPGRSIGLYIGLAAVAAVALIAVVMLWWPTHGGIGDTGDTDSGTAATSTRKAPAGGSGARSSADRQADVTAPSGAGKASTEPSAEAPPTTRAKVSSSKIAPPPTQDEVVPPKQDVPEEPAPAGQGGGAPQALKPPAQQPG